MVKMSEMLIEVLREMPAQDRQAFLQQAQEAVERTEDVPEVWQGRPRDAAVQAFAGAYLRLHRDPEFRDHWLRRVGNDATTYEEIAKEAGVTRERVRMLFAHLCPFLYESQKRLRTA